MAETFTTYYHSPLGPVKITATELYISEVSFHDSTQKHPPHKKHLPPLLIQCVEELIQYFNGGLRQFNLPLKQEGTSFQQEVWGLLSTIPFGRTITYLELARKTGDVKATRAVASANGKNRIAIIVPCHRVIGSNGDLVGYAGGLRRKKWLLEHEARLAWGVQTLF